MTLFVKRYADPVRADAARGNYRWLASLNSGVLLPDLVKVQSTTLTFAKLDGAKPGLGDLVLLAATIGQLQHAGAPELIDAQLDRPHHTGGHVIEDFTRSRQVALHRAAATHGIDPLWIDEILDRAPDMTPAFYKDSNLRNFILTQEGVAVVDFDDLTLAPHGYDLAKLITSVAMTFGNLNVQDISAALDAYHTAVGHDACAAKDLAIWAELNWMLTANYLGRNGYGHPWPQVRPWRDPLQEGI